MLLSSFAANSPEAGKQHTLAKISVTSLTFNLNNKPVIFKPAYKPAYKPAFKWAFQARPLHYHFVSRWQTNPAFSSQRFDSNFESAFAISQAFESSWRSIRPTNWPFSHAFKSVFWVLLSHCATGSSCALSISHTLAKKPSDPYLSWTFGKFWIHTLGVTFQTIGVTFRKYRIE